MKRNISVAVALMISLFIYVFYRSEKTVVNELVTLFLSIDTYSALKCSIVKTLPLNETIIYSLPGGLWIYCVTVLSRNFYLEIGQRRLQVLFVPVSFAVGLELCQLFQFTQGRFDWWDIIFYFLFWLVAANKFSVKDSQQNILSPLTPDSLICLACFFSVYLAHVSQ